MPSSVVKIVPPPDASAPEAVADPLRSTPSQFNTTHLTIEVMAWVRKELSRRAETGQTIRVEEYRILAPTRELSVEQWLELIELEIGLRWKRGETPRLAEYVARFPDWATRIEANCSLTESSSGLEEYATLRIEPSGVRVEPSEPLAATPPEIPGYRILELLGRGGMGVVYKAVQTGLNRVVALKMILNDLVSDSEERRRFQIEAESVASLRHPNIVQVYEIGEHESRPFFSLEYVEGGTLHQLISGRPQSPRFAAEIVAQLAMAVDHAHRHGILHRDLKPANILMAGVASKEKDPATSDEPTERSTPSPSPEACPSPLAPIPKITDFGLAKRIDAPTNLTQTGFVAGTPQYMPPEQIRASKDEKLGPTADIYALGIILYELLCGRPPFQSEHPLEVMNLVLRQTPSSPRRLQSGIPRDLETICLKCLEKDPSKRYSTAAELGAELTAFLEGRPIQARPIGSVSQAWRWCRRNPMIAGLLTAIFLTMSMAVWVVLLFAMIAHDNAELAESQSRSSRENAAKLAHEVRISQANAERADLERQNAERTTRKITDQDLLHRRELYASRMLQAHRAYEMGNLGRARQLLQDAEPLRRGETDFRSFEWYYLNSLCWHDQRYFTVPYGARGVAVSPDGKSILWGFRNTGTIFDLTNGVQKFALMTDPKREILLDDLDYRAVRNVAFSPDGKRIAISSPRFPLQVWTVDNRKRVFSVPESAREPGAIAFSPDSDFIALSEDCPHQLSTICRVRIFHTDRDELSVALPDHESGVVGVAFSPDGQTLATLTRSGRLRFWDWRERKLLDDVATPGTARCLAWSPNNADLAVGHFSGAITIYSPTTRKEVRRIAAHRDVIKSLSFSRDGQYLASGSRDSLAKVWISGTGELVRICRGHEDTVNSVCFDPTRPTLYTAGLDDRVISWDFLVDREKFELRLDVGQLVHAKPTADGKRLSTLSATGKVVTIDLDSHREIENSRTEGFAPRTGRAHLAVPDRVGNRSLILGGSRDRLLEWPIDGSPIKPLNFPNLRPEIVNLAVSPDGKRVATIHRMMEVHLHDVADPTKTTRFLSHLSHGKLFLFHPRNPELLLIGCHDGLIRVWNATTGKQEASWAGHEKAPVDFAVNRDGSRLLTVGEDGSILLWSLKEHSLIRRINSHSGPLERVIFSPDETRAVTAGKDCQVRFWDLTTGEEVLTLSSHQSGIDQMLFSPDGRQLITLGRDWRITFWETRDLPGRQQLRRFAVDCPLEGIEILPGDQPDTRSVSFFGTNRSSNDKPIVVQPTLCTARVAYHFRLDSLLDPEKPKPLQEWYTHTIPRTTLNRGDRWNNKIDYFTPNLAPGRYRVTVRSEWQTQRRSDLLAEVTTEFEVGGK